ncbi:MAG: hypothetical protein DRP82_01090 [Planctomycetota bacterium]|nr:MAG: hypothetical protein DRP82_01090 [Planctomycetota bacterium]
MRFLLFLLLCGCAAGGANLRASPGVPDVAVGVQCADKDFCCLLCSALRKARIAKTVTPFKKEEAETYFLVVNVEYHRDNWRGEPSRKNSSLNFLAYIAPWLPLPAMMNILPVVTVRVRNEAKVTLGYWTDEGFVALKKKGMKNPFVVSAEATQKRWLDRYWWTIKGWLPVSAFGKSWRSIFFNPDIRKIERLKKVADRDLANAIATRVVNFINKRAAR